MALEAERRKGGVYVEVCPEFEEFGYRAVGCPWRYYVLDSLCLLQPRMYRSVRRGAPIGPASDQRRISDSISYDGLTHTPYSLIK